MAELSAANNRLQDASQSAISAQQQLTAARESAAGRDGIVEMMKETHSELLRAQKTIYTVRVAN